MIPFKKAAAAVLLLSLSTQNLAWADPPLPPAAVDAVAPLPPAKQKEADPGPVMTPLPKGTPAPYTGVLLAPTSIATIVADYRAMPAKLTAAYEKGKGEASANCKFDDSEIRTACETDKAILREDISKKAKRISDLESEHVDAPSRTLWFGLGAGAGVVFTLVTVFVVVQATK